MNGKKLLKIIVISLLCLSLPCLALAHSGRTDGSGGHKDNKNASGLGSYHYHCGGYPAHLHSNGTCPYSASSSTPVKTSSSSTKTTKTTTSYTKPTFPVVVNGTNLNLTTSDYYPVVINDVTYVPLSSEVINALELNGGWVDASKGLVLTSN